MCTEGCGLALWDPNISFINLFPRGNFLLHIQVLMYESVNTVNISFSIKCL